MHNSWKDLELDTPRHLLQGGGHPRVHVIVRALPYPRQDQSQGASASDALHNLLAADRRMTLKNPRHLVDIGADGPINLDLVLLTRSKQDA